jgi:hypothetical protein
MRVGVRTCVTRLACKAPDGVVAAVLERLALLVGD